MIKITLPGEPISKDRPRFSKHGAYDPQKPQKHACKWQILDQLKNRPFLPFSDGVAIEIEMTFFYSIPKGQENLYSWGLLDHTRKPDYDNNEKFILDVLSGIVYQDDRQIHKAHATKEYSETPRTEIIIMSKQPECSDQIKEVLSFVSPKDFSELAYAMVHIADWCDKSECSGYIEKPDYDEAAFLILEFAEKHADNLKKINKKFPGLAKILKERMENK